MGTPILAGCNWITRPASKYIAFHLQKYYKLFDTIVTDQLDVLRFIETVELPAGCELSTIDVVSLYTNIPLDHFMEVIKKLFEDHPIPEAELLLDLLHFVLYNNLLQFDGTTYIQIFGFAMGTSFAPIGANIYLAILEVDLKKLYQSDPSLSWPNFYENILMMVLGLHFLL